MAIGTPVNLGGTAHGTAASSLALTTIADAPTGSLIFVGAQIAITTGTVVSSCADQVGHSYTPLGSENNAGGSSSGAAYSNNTGSDLPSGDTITVTYGTSATNQAVVACAVSGIATSSPLDINNVAANGNSTTPSASTGTLAQASELLLAVLAWNTANQSVTEDAGHGWTSLVTEQANGSTTHLAYQIVNATTSVTYAPTISAIREWTLQLFSFKGAGGAATPTTHELTLLGFGV